MENNDVAGIDEAEVTTWFEHHVPQVKPPLAFHLIAGGRSNLTFSVTDDAGERWVLRRPPLGHVLATAHDMGREHKIISALGPTDVPVAPAVGLCEDVDVNGAPFYVMRFVEGHIIRGADAARRIDEQARRQASESIVEVLARIHAVDPDAVGLGDLGRKEGYIARQLRRWYGQYEQSKTEDGDAPAVSELHSFLSARIPEQGPAAIVHGDYRLDNCMLDDDGNIAAVLDWELCTLGDPHADVGLLMVYWNEANDRGDDGDALAMSATAVEGFLTRRELLDRYAGRSGRDLTDIDFYVAFGYWKLACIIQGVYARYAAGVMGEANTAAVEGFRSQVDRLATLAQEAASNLS